MKKYNKSGERPFILETEKLEFHASCADGLLPFLQDEIKSFKLEIISSNRGGIHFRGKKNQIFQFSLNTRFSSRLSFVFNRLKAKDADELYFAAKKLPWELLIPDDVSFRIESFTKDSLSHSRFALYRLKDAVLDRIRSKREVEPKIDKDNPEISILLRSSFDNAVIQVSLSPHPLNQRGYRKNTLDAPIRENIAQALLEFSGWKPGELLIDPMCGSGTIPIEAAILLKNNLELNRKIFNESYIFKKLFPDGKINSEEKVYRKRIYGFDINPEAIKIAKENSIKAGVSDLIQFQESDFRNLNKGFVEEKGFIVSNPPYAVRMGSKEDIKELYSSIGKNLKNNFSGYSFSIICGDKSLLGYFKLKSEKELSLTIAKLKGKFVHYKIK